MLSCPDLCLFISYYYLNTMFCNSRSNLGLTYVMYTCKYNVPVCSINLITIFTILKFLQVFFFIIVFVVYTNKEKRNNSVLTLFAIVLQGYVASA